VDGWAPGRGRNPRDLFLGRQNIRRPASHEAVNMYRLFGLGLGVPDHCHDGRPKRLNSPRPCPQSNELPKKLTERWPWPIKPDQLSYGKRISLRSSVVVGLLGAGRRPGGVPYNLVSCSESIPQARHERRCRAEWFLRGTCNQRGREENFPTEHRHIWSYPSHLVNRHSIRRHNRVETLWPANRILVSSGSEHLQKRTVQAFHLAVALRMKGRRSGLVHSCYPAQL